MSKFQSYFIESLQRRVNVPDFENREEIDDFIDSLKDDDIIMDDIIDPETGDIIMEKGDTKRDKNKSDDEDLKNKSKNQANKFKDYLKKAKNKEEEDNQSPEEKYKLTIQEIEKKFRGVGQDLAKDWLYDHPNATEDKFDDWAQTSAEDGAISALQTGDPEIKNIKAFLKLKKIDDIKGWATDEVYEGMRKAFNK